jgi:hypothetical protein
VFLKDFSAAVPHELHALSLHRCELAFQKLWTYQGNFRAFKVLIAAEYNGIDIEVPEFAAADNKVANTI